jgi:hypothetical protein
MESLPTQASLLTPLVFGGTYRKKLGTRINSDNTKLSSQKDLTVSKLNGKEYLKLHKFMMILSLMILNLLSGVQKQLTTTPLFKEWMVIAGFWLLPTLSQNIQI